MLFAGIGASPRLEVSTAGAEGLEIFGALRLEKTMKLIASPTATATAAMISPRLRPL